MICNFYLSVAARKKSSRSVPEIHSQVAGTLNNQPTNNSTVNILLTSLNTSLCWFVSFVCLCHCPLVCLLHFFFFSCLPGHARSSVRSVRPSPQSAAVSSPALPAMEVFSPVSKAKSAVCRSVFSCPPGQARSSVRSVRPSPQSAAVSSPASRPWRSSVRSVRPSPQSAAVSSPALPAMEVFSPVSKAKSTACRSVSTGPQSFLWASTGLGHVWRLKASKVGQDCRMWLGV